jgi:3-deoxy-manno-octulosonate cytidylyltransferase (CMP-KDO synthetase)
MPIDQRIKGSKGQRFKGNKNPRILEPSSKAIAIIPARYNSTRLPGKPLVNILGKPMIQHVWERAMKAGKIERVIVATDDERVYNVVKVFGGEAAMTSKSHLSGTDRIAEVVAGRSLDTDIIVNIQGDEPMIDPDMIDQVVKLLQNDSRASIGTLCRKIKDKKEITDPNIVKVVFDNDGFALYFTRSPIPFHREGQGSRDKGQGEASYYKHIGIYSYRKEALLSLASMEPTPLEKTEKLEQLRALENGFRIKVSETDRDTIGVDTMEDLEKVTGKIKNG